jgi:hypothetical protein
MWPTSTAISSGRSPIPTSSSSPALTTGRAMIRSTSRRSKARRTTSSASSTITANCCSSAADGSTPSTEIWVNTGAADFPFERQGNAFIERGCIDRDSIVKLDNGTWFVGDDRIVYRLDGYTPVRMSTHAVEKTLARRRGSAASPTRRRATSSTSSTPTRDRGRATSRLERMGRAQSFGLDYYRCGCAVEAYGKTLFGDNQTGKFYEPIWTWFPRTAWPCRSRSSFPPIGDGVSRQTLYVFELFMETGVGDLTTTDPQAILTYSKNGGRSWSNEMWRDLGAQGEYTTRAVWRNQCRVPPASASDRAARQGEALRNRLLRGHSMAEQLLPTNQGTRYRPAGKHRIPAWYRFLARSSG